MRGCTPPSRSRILTDEADVAVCCPEIDAMAEPDPSAVTMPLSECDEYDWLPRSELNLQRILLTESQF